MFYEKPPTQYFFFQSWLCRSFVQNCDPLSTPTSFSRFGMSSLQCRAGLPLQPNHSRRAAPAARRRVHPAALRGRPGLPGLDGGRARHPHRVPQREGQQAVRNLPAWGCSWARRVRIHVLIWNQWNNFYTRSVLCLTDARCDLRLGPHPDHRFTPAQGRLQGPRDPRDPPQHQASPLPEREGVRVVPRVPDPLEGPALLASAMGPRRSSWRRRRPPSRSGPCTLATCIPVAAATPGLRRRQLLGLPPAPAATATASRCRRPDLRGRVPVQDATVAAGRLPGHSPRPRLRDGGSLRPEPLKLQLEPPARDAAGVRGHLG